MIDTLTSLACRALVRAIAASSVWQRRAFACPSEAPR